MVGQRGAKYLYRLQQPANALSPLLPVAQEFLEYYVPTRLRVSWEKKLLIVGCCLVLWLHLVDS